MAKTIEQGLLEKINSVLNETISPTKQYHIDEPAKLWTGDFYAITALHDTVLDVDQCDLGILEKASAGGTQPIEVDITIPQGMTIYGNFKSIEISSGSCLAYSKGQQEVTVEA
tara:strand:+ start:111 stop:449 length:339 start_codon:yes stop_codon:yes gene_type:complete